MLERLEVCTKGRIGVFLSDGEQLQSLDKDL